VQLCLEALANDRERRPIDVGALANTLSSLGNAYFFSGNLTAAEPPLREALQLREQVFGMSHARTGTSLNNLGVLLYQSGRYKEALEAYEKALPIYRQVYTSEHPEVATLINNIGRAELMAGNVDAADRWLRQALLMTEKFEGKDHDDLVPTLNSLGMIDAYRGKLDAARSEVQRAETIARMRQHSDLLDQVLLNEADLEIATGNKARASMLLAESKALLQKSYPNDSTTAWRYAIWDSVNAELLAANGDMAKASRTLAAAQVVINKRFGSNGFYSLRAQRLASNLASK
jgi:tetratricopeptide (TPR) repeat protein